MYRIVFLILSSVFLLACSNSAKKTINLPYYNTPDFSPIFISNKDSIEKNINHKIGSFSFLNQDSLYITDAFIKDKIHIANFMFTSCISICPSMMSNMKIISDSLKEDKDLAFLSYTVTPWIDSPRVLKEYQGSRNIDNPNWQLLTARQSEIYKLARQSYFAEEDIGFSRDSTEFLHTEHFILVDKNQRIRGIYNGTLLLEMYHLIDDIEVLRKEA